MSTNALKTAVVTGDKSDLALGIAKELKAAGYRVYDISSRITVPKGINHMTCDISYVPGLRTAIESIISSNGRIDILVNVCESGITDDADFTETRDYKKQYDAILFGAVNICNEVVPVMKKQGFGTIANISSYVAAFGLPFQAYSSSGIAALKAYTLALASELKIVGINVCCFDLPDSMLAENICAGTIAKKLQQDRLPEHIVLGGKYKIFLLLMKILPTNLTRYIIEHNKLTSFML